MNMHLAVFSLFLISILVNFTSAFIFKSDKAYDYTIWDVKLKQQVCKANFITDAIVEKYAGCKNESDEAMKNITDQLENVRKDCKEKMYARLTDYSNIKSELGKNTVVFSCYSGQYNDCVEGSSVWAKYWESYRAFWDKIKKCQNDAIGKNN